MKTDESRSISYPKPVRYALRVLWSAAWIGVIAGVAIAKSAMSPTDDATSLIPPVIVFLFFAVLLLKFSQKRAWARVVLLILLIPQTLGSLLGAVNATQSAPLLSAVAFVQAVLCGVGAYFLFQSGPKAWCSSPESDGPA